MLVRVMVLVLAIVLGGISGVAQAMPWTGHYLAGANITSLGGNHYLFEYEVANLDQGSGIYQGLDGFYLQVPLSATVINVTEPNSYVPGGYWGHGFGIDYSGIHGTAAALQPGYQWLYWWGYDPASVYPVGATARFSVELDNVALGNKDAVLVTYWGPNSYTGYEGSLVGPVTTPLPASLALLAPALAALLWGRRRGRADC